MSIVEQIRSLVPALAEETCPLRRMLGSRFLCRVQENFEIYSDEEQIGLLEVLPGGYLPSFAIVHKLFQRTNHSYYYKRGLPSYWDQYCSYVEAQAKRHNPPPMVNS